MEAISTVLQELIIKILEFLPKAILAMVIFVIALYLAGMVTKLVRLALERRGTDHEVKMVVVQVTRWSIIILGIFISLQQMGFDLSAFLVSLGVVGFTIGFALQDISKNFIAGLLILLQQPFDLGDAIKIDEFVGTVVNVDLRATEIKTFDGKIVLIPNADVYTSPITNYSRETNRRLELKLGVAYGTDLERVKQVALETLAGVETVLKEPVPEIAFDNFGGSSIDCTIYYWFNAKEESLASVRDAVIVAINAAFEEQNIEMPFPTQKVLLQQ
jgi:small conductance mechanosensitive channel